MRTLGSLVVLLLGVSYSLAEDKPLPTVQSMSEALNACITAVADRDQDPILNAGEGAVHDVSGSQVVTGLVDHGNIMLRLQVVNEGPNNKKKQDQYQCHVLRIGTGPDQRTLDLDLMEQLAGWASDQEAVGRFMVLPAPRPKSEFDRLLIQCREGNPDIAVFLSPQGAIRKAGAMVLDLPDGSKRCAEAG